MEATERVVDGPPGQRPAHEIVREAHDHERQALVYLGLTPAAVTRFAPPRVQHTGTRSAFVLGLRAVLVQLVGAPSVDGARTTHGITATDDALLAASGRADRADALYWALAHSSRYIAEKRWYWLGSNPDDGVQEGLIWLHKAATLFNPTGNANWYMHATRWLQSRAGRENLPRTLPLDDMFRYEGEEYGEGLDGLRIPGSRQINRAPRHYRVTEESAARDEHGPEVATLLARLRPVDAWLLARKYGLWGPPATVSALQIEHNASLAVLHRDLDTAAGAMRRARRKPSPKLCNLTALRWLIHLQDGQPVTAIADREGVPADTVSTAAARMYAEIRGSR